MNVIVIGSGAWGTTLAGVANSAGSDVTLVARNPVTCQTLSDERSHPVSLPGYRLSERIRVVPDISRVLGSNVDVAIVAVPSASIHAVGEAISSTGYDGPVVTAAKGIEPERLLTPSQNLEAAIGSPARIAALSGPNLAREIALGLPAAAVVASNDEPVARAARDALMSESFRIYTSTDIIGVEIAGALKNVIAIGAGIADGLDAGENAKAAYLTRGIAEMARLGAACGANPMTFAGLAGIGDLMATANSSSSRNNTVGRALVAGKPLHVILDELHEVAEGVPTTRAALMLGRSKGVDLPITAQIARVMFEGVSPVTAIAALMARDATEELDIL